ncbi:glycosyltransferase family 4 protein [Labedella endophytica]|uniref:glycosyltransferase family 4 protein n=1 Tax=Labedella endophytica TaxID=1523160 RepID=UPI00140A967A|nr:glycosyltransferase family 4 protein [Labedella endophytica]
MSGAGPVGAPATSDVPAGRLPALLLHDEPRHGVARYAREVAEEIARLVGRDLGVAESEWGAGSAPERIHAQFTDRLWARSPEDAAARFVALAAGRQVSVTLHDVPQPSDGHAFERRIAAYSVVIGAAELVIVNSRHELALLDEVGLRPAAPVVVAPLPASPALHLPPSATRPSVALGEGCSARDEASGAAESGAPGEPGAATDPTVAVLGYIYPGKGHRETIEATAEAGVPLAVRALGAPSPGHEADAAELVSLGATLGVDVTVSGFLSDDELITEAARVAVPVVAHQHFSASGSINSWVSAGRRPLVLRTRYTEEMDALRPGTLTLVDPSGLADAIARAHADPASTVLATGTSTRPHLDDTAAAYLAAWRGEAL